MANVASTQTLLNGARNCVVKVTLTSDGTDESDVVKVDASALGIAVDGSVRCDRIDYSTTSANSLVIEWDGSSDAILCTIPSDDAGTLDWKDIGGLKNNATAPTGDITVTSTLDANDIYTLVFHLVK